MYLDNKYRGKQILTVMFPFICYFDSDSFLYRTIYRRFEMNYHGKITSMLSLLRYRADIYNNNNNNNNNNNIEVKLI